ncbi:hypothetical protein [Bacillus cereus]|uniref:hypothetical protein n=1 Tax=Bacillus cereus TaxID=1396 RepID=UPI000B5AA187|nr:hypothetical protein [Bacillus cereus]ASJ51930.1 hypothetical protein BA204_28190 [Bacillus cereus]PFC92471.1 hypothetical protein CN308_23210 [Bacillus cereus]
MKLTLFTISNEQIKEQLSKLQTKVESLEAVKDVQDKIISAKDSQITFLQGEISSISNWVIFVGGAIITLASAAFIYIRYLEKKATKKIEEAENTLQLVTEKLAEVENSRQQTERNLTESNSRIEQLDILIDKSNNVATVAQEKIDKLEEKHKELNKLSSSLVNNQKVDITLNNIKFTLDFIKRSLMTLISDIHDPSLKEPTEQQQKQKEEYIRFKNNYERLGHKHTKVSLNFNKKIKSGKILSQQDIEIINKLENECVELKTEIYDYLENY